MARQNFLAFDFGAESGRSILGTLEKAKLSLHETHRFDNPNGTMNGVLQWDVLKQWEEIKTGLRRSAAALDGEPLAGIGVDTWAVDFGLLGADGQLLMNPVCYRDARTHGMMEAAFATVPKRDIFDATGIQFLPFNTLYQLFAAKRAKSSALEAARTLLFMPDLFNYLLTGIARAEFSVATTSQMYDPQRKMWAIELLRKLGLPLELLPPIIDTGTILGPLLESVRQETSAPPAPVIATAGHDTAAAVVAVPAEEGTNWAYLSSGTWSLLGVELAEPCISDKAFTYNYTNEGGVGGSIRFLKNIMGLWLVQECRREFERRGEALDYAALTKAATDAQPFRSLVYVNDDRFLAPGQMPQKIAAFCREHGQPEPTTPGEIVRCCLDSLALHYRLTIDGLEDILGRRIDILHLVGGGTQNELLNQLTADAIGRPVTAGPIEATAIGNILVQAMAVGAVGSLAEARMIVRESFPVKRYEPGTGVPHALERYRSLAK